MFQFGSMNSIRMAAAIAVLCSTGNLPAVTISGNSLVVNTLSDDTTPDNGLLSLREAIEAANDAAGPDDVHFAPSLNGVIGLTEGEMVITDDVTIDGPGAGQLVVSGGNLSRIFNIAADVTVQISGLKIRDGCADGGAPDYAGMGGGILNRGDLTLVHVVMTDNQAVGDSEVDVPVSEAIFLAGTAGGGAVCNFGNLTASQCAFDDNQALGADGTVRTIGAFPIDPFGAGIATGGAVWCNYASEVAIPASADFDHCQFNNNLAIAGDDGVGDFAAASLGGAIATDSPLTVSHCGFNDNRSEAGDGSLAAFNNGHGDGGAISSGSIRTAVIPTDPGAALTVSQCQFDDNHAVGGDESMVVLPPDQIPVAHGPGNAHGGAILAWQGTASIHHSGFNNNRSIGGDGNAASNGGRGIAGAVFLFGFIGQMNADVSHVSVIGSRAVGGSGMVGSEGIGGGITIGSYGSLFGAGANADVSRSLFFYNQAIAGSGSSANGGNAQGGGIANGDGGNTTLVRDVVFFNKAIGGDGDTGDGTGFGGGIFNAGVIDIDAFTQFLTRWNQADEGSNIFGQ